MYSDSDSVTGTRHESVTMTMSPVDLCLNHKNDSRQLITRTSNLATEPVVVETGLVKVIKRRQKK